jgi:hypothetical protein
MLAATSNEAFAGSFLALCLASLLEIAGGTSGM